MSGRATLLLACWLLTACGAAAATPNDGFGLPPGSFVPADAAAAIAAAPSGYVFVDAPPAPELRSDQSLTAAGWAFVPPRTPCAAIGLVVDRRKVLPGNYGTPRSDVAGTFAEYALFWSGYNFKLPARALGRGRHDVYVVCKGRDGQMLRTPATFTVRVR